MPGAQMLESSHAAELMLRPEDTFKAWWWVCSYNTVPICNESRSAFNSAVCHLVIGEQTG